MPCGIFFTKGGWVRQMSAGKHVNVIGKGAGLHQAITTGSDANNNLNGGGEKWATVRGWKRTYGRYGKIVCFFESPMLGSQARSQAGEENVFPRDEVK